MTNLQTFMVCKGYAQAMCTCDLLDQEDLSDQFLDAIYEELRGTHNGELYATACLINKAEVMTTAVDSATADVLDQYADFAEYLASQDTSYTATVDAFITVMRFAVACLDDGLYEAHEDGWLVSDMVNTVFIDAELHGHDVTFATDKRAVSLLNKLMALL